MCSLQVHPLFGTIYNSIYLLAKSIHNARKAGMWLSGSNLAYFTKNISFNGFNQRIQVDNAGELKTNFVILDSDNTEGQLYQTYLVDLSYGVLRFAGRSIHFPGGAPPPSDSSCWFDKTAVCTGGRAAAPHQWSFKSLYFYCISHASCIFNMSFSPKRLLSHQLSLSSSGVEVTYIIVVFAVIFVLALGGLAISFYVRYSFYQIQNTNTLIMLRFRAKHSVLILHFHSIFHPALRVK